MLKSIFENVLWVLKSRKFIDLNYKNLGDLEQSNNKSDSIILFEFTSMCSSHIVFSYLVKIMEKIYSASSAAITVNTYNKKRRIFYKVLSLLNLSYFSVYRSFGVNKFFVLEGKNLVKRNIKFPKNKLEFLEYNYKNIRVGDLIYDSYLRYNYTHTADLKSADFKKFFCNSLDYFDSVRKVFKENNVKAIVLTHTVYLHGYIGRYALSKNIDYYCAGISHLIKLSKEDHFVHNHKLYKLVFDKLPKNLKEKGISLAKKDIKEKLSGSVSFNMENLPVSPFNKKIDNSIIDKNSKIKVLVATQCLVDSPHAFGNWFFGDFGEWLEYLGKLSDKTDYDWYIKPHPNNYRRNTDFINAFLKKYKKFKLIPTTFSHYSLQKKIDFVLTNWGNIGIDLALLNIKVINTHTNGRFCSFNFNINPSSSIHYKKILNNLAKYKNFKINKKEIYEAYFMQNIFYGPGWMIPDYTKEMRELSWKNKDKVLIYEYWVKKFNKRKHIDLTNKVERFLISKKNSNVWSKFSILDN